jgi:hypothetical protein
LTRVRKAKSRRHRYLDEIQRVEKNEGRLLPVLTGVQDGLKQDYERNLKPEVATTSTTSPEEVWELIVVACLRK